ncbi:hypothetical protein BE221DRAFT_167622 [Ostreococcus tauri]|uniref:Uncharacterized protein n=1 Tax=Ostreococcus tauri TaxID=70448 RepID=A0A1Y5IG41_OSTTA|nr:hypothetical protein BE221DRAFT_167622 [Ostreococcus tauri]
MNTSCSRRIRSSSTNPTVATSSSLSPFFTTLELTMFSPDAFAPTSLSNGFTTTSLLTNPAFTNASTSIELAISASTFVDNTMCTFRPHLACATSNVKHASRARLNRLETSCAAQRGTASRTCAHQRASPLLIRSSSPSLQRLHAASTGTTRSVRGFVASALVAVFIRRVRYTCTRRMLDVNGLARALDGVRDLVVRRDARSGDPSSSANDGSSDGEEDNVGRIESVLAGNDQGWHLRVNRVERGKLRASYAVAHARGVPVRAQPHIDSAVLRYFRRGEVVVGVSLTSDGWLELAGEDASGANVDGSAGWMLTEHREHGILLKRVGGIELPRTTMRLAAAEAVLSVDHTHLPLQRGAHTFRVTHSPFVAVRAAPSMSSNIIGHKTESQLVVANARRGDWIRCVDSDNGPRAKDCSTVHERWMLTVHPEIGRLLRRCNADGSDAIDSVE